jgi:hypothetical protein
MFLNLFDTARAFCRMIPYMRSDGINFCPQGITDQTDNAVANFGVVRKRTDLERLGCDREPGAAVCFNAPRRRSF